MSRSGSRRPRQASLKSKRKPGTCHSHVARYFPHERESLQRQVLQTVLTIPLLSLSEIDRCSSSASNMLQGHARRCAAGNNHTAERGRTTWIWAKCSRATWELPNLLPRSSRRCGRAFGAINRQPQHTATHAPCWFHQQLIKAWRAGIPMLGLGAAPATATEDCQASVLHEGLTGRACELWKFLPGPSS